MRIVALLGLTLILHGAVAVGADGTTDDSVSPEGVIAGDSTAASEEECLPCGDEEEEGGLFGLLGVDEEEGLRVGVQAPSFALQDLDGKGRLKSEEAFAARPLTVVIFWDSYCPKCLRALVDYARFAEEADSLGVGMLSINFDHEHLAKVRAFVKGEKLPFPVLWDADERVVGAYLAMGHDISLFVVDNKGQVRAVRYGRPSEPLEELRAEVRSVLRSIARERAEE
ncbi:MAG: TlpA family protein disulfide reductase [Gemmatimonadetes bacterium]|jgi:peroxiredoxin|nr:TlpA family protein disulfide reductase [Gemmatimonadota bacterium]